MNLKKLYVASCATGILLGAGLGAKVFAENYWEGHEDVVAVNKDLDLLSTKLHGQDKEIEQLSSDLSTAKNSSQSFSSQVTILQQKLIQSEQASQEKAAEDQRKLTESNQHLQVANQQLATANTKSSSDDQKLAAAAQELSSKQSELDTANTTIANLQKQIQDLQQATQTSSSTTVPASNTPTLTSTSTPTTNQATGTPAQTTVTAPSTTQNYPNWNASTQYVANDIVSYNGNYYKAGYWADHNTPDKGAAWTLVDIMD